MISLTNLAHTCSSMLKYTNSRTMGPPIPKAASLTVVLDWCYALKKTRGWGLILQATVKGPL
jgi:hypothetical protein